MIEIVLFGHPALRGKGAPIGEIDDEIQALAAEMLEAMQAAHGVGLAAQQVGHLLQLAIVDVSGAEDQASRMWVDGKECDPEQWMPMVMVNPQIEFGAEKESGVEGCLSFPEITAEITRSSSIAVATRLIDGQDVEFEAEGLLARVIQHEYDHLQGVLFIDRMGSATRASLAGTLKRLKKETERGLKGSGGRRVARRR